MKNTDNFFLPYLINQTFLSAHLSTIDSKSFQFQSFFTLKHSTYNKKCILNFIFKTIIKYFPTYKFFSLSCFLAFLQFVLNSQFLSQENEKYRQIKLFTLSANSNHFLSLLNLFIESRISFCIFYIVFSYHPYQIYSVAFCLLLHSFYSHKKYYN